jgi:SHS2 domain-containing protein
VYRWIEHTGELELAIDAPAERTVFADAFAAFVDLVGDDDGPDPTGHGRERREVELHGTERDVLLADWLDELVYLADAQQFVPESLIGLRLESGRLRATVDGHRGEPRGLVKAVTLHRLAFGPDGSGGWHARVVLDV